MIFRDRAQAGRALAQRLMHLRSARPVVLALPRGGVPVAAEIAEALAAPLDLLLVRKIGAPGMPEFALGAVVEGTTPEMVLNEEAVRRLGVPREYLEGEAARQYAEIGRQRELYLRGRPFPGLQGHTAIVVDDGIATGATMRAALRGLAQAGAARSIVLAAPVAPPETAAALRDACDEAVFLEAPENFAAVGAFYADFKQVEDNTVMALLERAASRGMPWPGE
ncbi:phosphoribosyltransferase [Roseomonas sp. M0104]|uniref:Phosphoribosyltransferase n=1 Tax=Teichococcus coralli TaxID=2545983 RepID=A0A845B8J9_9PROT|nr:phosphoribosyltransferase family protein [Pseudoroseomonas coralli]MXP63035.1 phosphoribosyltransferase [Pseudoroseomonas coralli]